MVGDMGIRSGSGTVISEWAKDVGIHYEKKRRENIVAVVRDIIEDPAGDETGVGVRVEEVMPAGHAGSGSEDESVASSSVVVDAAQTDDEEGSAWDFDDTPGAGPSTADSTEPQPPETPAEPPTDEEAWGFDDDLELPTSPPPPPPPPPAESTPSEAEGWDWDDNPPQTPGLPPPDSSSAKPARGLERFAAPRHTPGGQSTSSGHEAIAAGHVPVPTISAPPKKHKITRSPETYLVSPSASKILQVAKQTLAETEQLQASR